MLFETIRVEEIDTLHEGFFTYRYARIYFKEEYPTKPVPLPEVGKSKWSWEFPGGNNRIIASSGDKKFNSLTSAKAHAEDMIGGEFI